MNDKQLKTHVRLWSAAARANGWRMSRGRLLSRPENELSPDARRVLAVATQMAGERSAAPTDRDLRYACYLIRLGRLKETKALTNRDIDLVWPLFRLLAEPVDLTSINEMARQQRGEDPGAERRVEWYIRQRAPKAYADAVARSLGVTDWEELDLAGKHALARKLADRPALDGGRRGAAETGDAELAAVAAGDTENEPF